MQHAIQLLASLLLFCSLQCACLAQTGLFDNVTNLELTTPVNDVVYDPDLDVLYASIPSRAGFPFGNSIATIDPATGEVTDSVFVGSEPNTLAISPDGSHIFVGIDGSESVRSYQPATGTLSPVVSLNGSIASDIAVFPGQPSAAVVFTGSSTFGALVVFDGLTISSPLSLGFLSSPNHLGFASPTTLVGYNDASTAFTASTLEFDGTELVAIDSQQEVNNRFDVEAEVGPDGLLYLTNGPVLDPETFDQLGFFNTSLPGLSLSAQLVEAVPSVELVYFVAPSDDDIVLFAFDMNRFLQIDSVVLPTSATTPETRGELVFAGPSRLAFVFKPDQGAGPGGSGTLNIVSGIQPAASVLLGDCNQDGIVSFLDVSPFVSILSTGGFRVEADINEDGSVDFLDIGPFITLLSS